MNITLTVATNVTDVHVRIENSSQPGFSESGDYMPIQLFPNAPYDHAVPPLYEAGQSDEKQEGA